MLIDAVVLSAPLVASAMVVSRLATIFGVIKPPSIVLPSFHAQVATAAVNKLLHVLLITRVYMEGRESYVGRVSQVLGLTFLMTIVLKQLENVTRPSSLFVSSATVFVTLFFGCIYQQLRVISKESFHI